MRMKLSYHFTALMPSWHFLSQDLITRHLLSHWQIEHFPRHKLSHTEVPLSPPLEQVLALNEYEPLPAELLSSIRNVDPRTHLRSIHRPNVPDRLVSEQQLAALHHQIRQMSSGVAPQRRMLRHVQPMRRPCFPLVLDEKDDDSWW